MSDINDLDHHRAVKKELKLRNFVSQLDTVGEILYNNLEYDGVWKLIEQFEDVRVRYSIEHYEYEDIVKNKGRVDGNR